MCNVFSGHVVTSNDEHFGKVLFFSGLHHEKDRELPEVAKHGSNLLAWETVVAGSFNDGVKMTHDCGQQLSADRIKALLELVQEWGEKQSFEFLTKNFTSEAAYKFCRYCKPTKAERAWLVPRIIESYYAYMFCRNCNPTESERALLVPRIIESYYAYLFCRDCNPTKAEQALLVPNIKYIVCADLFCQNCNPTDE